MLEFGRTLDGHPLQLTALLKFDSCSKKQTNYVQEVAKAFIEGIPMTSAEKSNHASNLAVNTSPWPCKNTMSDDGHHLPSGRAP